MLRALLLLLASATLAALPAADSENLLHVERSSPGDLEVGGDLADLQPSDQNPSPGTPGLRPGSTRYVRYEDLLRLPQETYTVTDDTNFSGKTEVEGVALATLVRLIGKAPDDTLIVAICYDKYRANYPVEYMSAHHPLLVLRINGQLRDHWPLSEYGGPLGPYLVSHPSFRPAFKVLAHEDEPEIPFGVTRIELRRESQVFGAIRPRGNWPTDSPVQHGYLIARQDCFRCHNMGREGGTMAGRNWMHLAMVARDNATRFRETIRNPISVSPGARMPAHAEYDDATLDALTAYFKTFATAGRSR